MNLVIGGTYRHKALWARPLKMFFDKVIVNGVEVNRFEYIENKDIK